MPRCTERQEDANTLLNAVLVALAALVVEFFLTFFGFKFASLAFSTISCALRIEAGDGGGESVIYRVNYR